MCQWEPYTAILASESIIQWRDFQLLNSDQPAIDVGDGGDELVLVQHSLERYRIASEAVASRRNRSKELPAHVQARIALQNNQSQHSNTFGLNYN